MILEILANHPDYVVTEESISPFELQKADELFLTNVITGIQPITQYRKKKFVHKTSAELTQKLNEFAGLSTHSGPTANS